MVPILVHLAWPQLGFGFRIFAISSKLIEVGGRSDLANKLIWTQTLVLLCKPRPSGRPFRSVCTVPQPTEPPKQASLIALARVSPVLSGELYKLRFVSLKLFKNCMQSACKLFITTDISSAVSYDIKILTKFHVTDDQLLELLCE